MANVEMLSLEFGRSPDNIGRISKVQCSKLTHQCSLTIDQYAAKPFKQNHKYYNTHNVTANESGLDCAVPMHYTCAYDLISQAIQHCLYNTLWTANYLGTFWNGDCINVHASSSPIPNFQNV